MMSTLSLPRSLTTTLRRLLSRFAAIGIIGARQTGKTFLVKALIKDLAAEGKKVRYFDLENPSDFLAFEQADFLLRSLADHTIIIDEIQRMPTLFPLLRSLIDEERRSGRFILLGSAKPSLMRSSGESLAGRIVYLELGGIHLKELLPPLTLTTHWLRGGFPEPLLEDEDEFRALWFQSFIATYVEQDLPSLGFQTRIPLRKLLAMLAWQSGGLLNQSGLARSLSTSQPSIANALQWFEDTFLTRQLSPFFINLGKRITKSPKVYLRDSGLLHYLLGISSYEELVSHPQAGMLFESYALEQIALNLPPQIELYFYRTQKGADCDLVLVKNNQPLLAIDFKLSASKIERGFRQSIQDLGVEKAYLVSASPQPATQLDAQISVCHLSDFIDILGGL